MKIYLLIFLQYLTYKFNIYVEKSISNNPYDKNISNWT